MADGRQFERSRSHQLVKVTHPHGTELTNIQDFSVSGVRFCVNSQLARDAHVALLLNMYMPEATRVISAEARVVWTTRVNHRGPYMAGAEFTKIAPEDRAYLQDLIDEGAVA